MLAAAALLMVRETFAAQAASALQQTAPDSPLTVSASPEHLLLILPFDNHSGHADLDWIGEAAPQIINRRLGSAGFMPISREDRLYALEHLGLPASFKPSRAGAIRLAQTLDADDVIVGSFSVAGERLKIDAQVLNMSALHMTAPIEEEADLPDLLTALNTLAWKLAGQLTPNFPVALKTFLGVDPHLNINAFENYVRGVMTADTPDGVQRLKDAVRLDPSYAPALFALGMAYFSGQQYDLAAATLGRLPTNDPNASEADFYRGLAYLYTGSYQKAEDAFAFVSRQLPLPQVVNDEGVAASRRGLDAVNFFRRAAAADPTDADYQFNLAVALERKNDTAGALASIAEALKLRPQDSEAREFSATLHTHPPPSPAKKVPGADRGATDPTDDNLPLERVKRSFNEAAFRQAVLEMDQIEAQRLAHLPPAQHAASLTQEGTRFFYQGLILEAEHEFQEALALDDRNAQAHAGLAAVRERVGDANSARQQASRSVALEPNVMAYLVLARLDLAANQLPAAAADVSHALALEPQNAEARQLQQKLETRGQKAP